MYFSEFKGEYVRYYLDSLYSFEWDLVDLDSRQEYQSESSFKNNVLEPVKDSSTIYFSEDQVANLAIYKFNIYYFGKNSFKDKSYYSILDFKVDHCLQFYDKDTKTSWVNRTLLVEKEKEDIYFYFSYEQCDEDYLDGYLYDYDSSLSTVEVYNNSFNLPGTAYNLNTGEIKVSLYT